MAIADVSSLPLAELVSLRGRCAVVTGGASGMGFATARRLAEAGASVLIGDLNEDAAHSAAAAIAEEFGAKVIGRHLDVRSESSLVGLADAAVAQLGGLDIWVNNAGIYPLCPVEEMSVEAWQEVQDVNLRGTFVGAREAMARMKASGTRKGVIVNVASIAGFRGRARLAHYTASKHAVIGLTKSLALELGPVGIRVLAVAPGVVETEGLKSRGLPAATAAQAASAPLGRLGVADDIARAVLFCASDLAMFMSGASLVVDGGATAE
ncbi:MAG TPA: SDR family oxidoreductase [Ramlibacter sp.]|nr:SDR family oxidoreductase [Ramlibacter sp.]